MTNTTPLRLLLLIAALLVFATADASGQSRRRRPSATPAGVVRAFYTHHFSHDMGLTERTLRAKRAWLVPELYDLLVYERRRPLPPDEVPYLNGDPFTDSQEYPTSFRVGRATAAARSAEVEVTFDWKSEGRVVAQRQYTLILLRLSNGWKIADIISRDGGSSLITRLRELKREDGGRG